jgi:pimeloyl-ACP methyl ester carboxylesterase
VANNSAGAAPARVTLDNVVFTGDSAIGGAGGTIHSSFGAGGGGGLGGAGGFGFNGGGGSSAKGGTIDAGAGGGLMTLALINRLGGAKALVIGHSMGSLVALEAAARGPGEIAGLGLIGAAANMPVHPTLLAAAAENHPDAVAMVSLWGLGPEATLGGGETPGLWMLGGAERLLNNAPPGALGVDLAACNAYSGGLAAAAKVTAARARRARPHDAPRHG